LTSRRWEDLFFTDFEQVEQEVSSRVGSYKGLSSSALLTSGEDFETIFKALPSTQVWVELGSGHGLGPLIFGSLYPEKRAIGVEFEPARVKASQDLQVLHKLPQVEFIEGDLLHCEIPQGDTYFLYFPTGPVLDRILQVLGSRPLPFQLVAIESHGDLLARLKKEAWLKVIQEIPLSQERHHPFARVFSPIGPKPFSLHDLSFEKRILRIQDPDGYEWLGESFGLEWVKDDEYQLTTPPRSFKLPEIRAHFPERYLDPTLLFLVRLRRLGELRILTGSTQRRGFLRKISALTPFKVEISTGERLQWEDISQIYWESTLCYDSSAPYFFYPPAV
jgi:hypothetical protein